MTEFDIACSDARRAADVHREVRTWALPLVRPGIKILDLCNAIETRILEFQGSIAFPCGIAVNEVAAHDTAILDDTRIIEEGDTVKVDFGTHYQGAIIDCAFTVALDPTYDPLVEAAREGTDAGIRAAGVDVRLGDVGAAIQEVVESYEVGVQRVRPVRNTCGHNLERYKVHAGKIVPTVAVYDSTRMKENEFYAIETFATTGSGYARESEDFDECTHFALCDEPFLVRPLPETARAFLRHLEGSFGSLPFCTRWLPPNDSLRRLCSEGYVEPYPVLRCEPGAHVAQFEHTIAIKAHAKEVLST